MKVYFVLSLIGSFIALVTFGDGLDSPFFLLQLGALICVGVVAGLNKLCG